MKTRADAFKLLTEYTSNPSLIKHALSVEAAMRWYAQYFKVPSDEIEIWGLTGLLHDFDYERWPEPVAPEGHPFKGNEILKSLGYPEPILRAIMGHAVYSGVPRDSLMAKALFAVDELCGLVTASVLVRPDRSIYSIEAKSVIKKMKVKTFAQGCNREEIVQGAAEIGVELEPHIQNVISALRCIASEIELSGNQQPTTNA